MNRFVATITLVVLSCLRVSVAADDATPLETESNGAPNATLRDELLSMMETDQAARDVLIASNFKDEAAADEVARIDRANTARMKVVVAENGWPAITSVGKQATRAAWLIVQHADADPIFQADCLERMEPMVAAGEASGQDFAYLTDRVLVNSGKLQRYGTQMHLVDGIYEPKPVEDAEHLDARREKMGLSTMARYRADMAARYGKAAAD